MPTRNSPRIFENFLKNKHLNLPEHFKALEIVPKPYHQSVRVMCTLRILENILGLWYDYS